uniref:Uncharacterized protein n=1 Tax=Solanum lycopersicum TaxID=4081 RepID=A0A3Q7H5I8_SOLLC
MKTRLAQTKTQVCHSRKQVCCDGLKKERLVERWWREKSRWETRNAAEGCFSYVASAFSGDFWKWRRQIQQQRTPFSRRNQYWWIRQIALDGVESGLTLLSPLSRGIFLQQLEDRLTYHSLLVFGGGNS